MSAPVSTNNLDRWRIVLAISEAISKLMALADEDEPVTTARGLQLRLDVAVSALATIAAATESPVDDALADVAGRVVENPLAMELAAAALAHLLGRFDAVREVEGGFDVVAELKGALSAAGGNL